MVVFVVLLAMAARRAERTGRGRRRGSERRETRSWVDCSDGRIEEPPVDCVAAAAAAAASSHAPPISARFSHVDQPGRLHTTTQQSALLSLSSFPHTTSSLLQSIVHKDSDADDDHELNSEKADDGPLGGIQAVPLTAGLRLRAYHGWWRGRQVSAVRCSAGRNEVCEWSY